jgi:hypothetical protein
MSPAAIKAKGDREALVYDTARQIRELLDGAREQYGAEAWAENDVESTVLELVSEEDPQ